MTLLLSLVLSAAQAAPEMIPLEEVDLVGRTAPELSLPLRGGGSFDLAQARGKPVVLSFWASWCGPCRQELPALSDLASRRDDVTIVAVNVDRESKDAERFLSQVRVDLPVALDPEATALGAYEVASMPTTFVVDRNGTLKWRKVGYSSDNGLDELIAVLDGGRK
ncbi:MAG: TlpA family protein disulfide reductase [Alphaproteobacteria bacterium]|nr:TlpA family protein disulfide reductase [Alphaproteobacteria bacterium]